MKTFPYCGMKLEDCFRSLQGSAEKQLSPSHVLHGASGFWGSSLKILERGIGFST